MKAVFSLLTLNDVMLMVLQGLLYNAALWWSLTATIFLALCQTCIAHRIDLFCCFSFFITKDIFVFLPGAKLYQMPLSNAGNIL